MGEYEGRYWIMRSNKKFILGGKVSSLVEKMKRLSKVCLMNETYKQEPGRKVRVGKGMDCREESIIIV